MSSLEVRPAFWRLYSACLNQSDRLLLLADGKTYRTPQDIQKAYKWRDIGEPWLGKYHTSPRGPPQTCSSKIIRWGPPGVREDVRILVRAVFSDDVALASAVVGEMRKLVPAPVDNDDSFSRRCIKQDEKTRNSWIGMEWNEWNKKPELVGRLPAWPEGFATLFMADVLLSAAVGYSFLDKVKDIVVRLLQHGHTTDVREVKRRFLALILFVYRINQQAPVYTMGCIGSDDGFAWDFSDMLRMLALGQHAYEKLISSYIAQPRTRPRPTRRPRSAGHMYIYQSYPIRLTPFAALPPLVKSSISPELLKGMALWQDHEVYCFTMDTSLIDLDGYGLGPKTFEVFQRAGFSKVGHLYPQLQQEAAVRTAAEGLAQQAGTAGEGYWRALAARCVRIIRRIRNPQYSPVIPEPFLCPVTYEELEDPVISPSSGITYERSAIERWLASRPEDPFNRQPLLATDLIPNRALRDAIAYYNANLRRFSIPHL
jgi:hypothetical protein